MGRHSAHAQATTGKKPGKGKIIAIVAIVVVVIGAAGAAGGGGGTQQKDAAQTTGTSAALQDFDKTQEAIDATIGKPLPEAMQAYSDAGASVTYYYLPDNGIEREVGSDPSAITGQGMEQDWIVADVKGSKVYIDTPGHLENMRQAKAREDALSAKMSYTDAYHALDSWGKNAYPYGFDLHYLLNDIAHSAVDENTWHLKTTVDITNEFGAKASDITIEADVSVDGTVSNVVTY